MKRLLPYVLLLAAVLPAPAAQAQQPAELAPAQTQVYLHIAEFDIWFDRMTQGPDGQAMRQELEQSPQWQVLLALLEMDTDTLFTTYFGGDVVVFAPDAQPQSAGVIFTQVDPDDAEYARDRLFLEAVDHLGDTAIYRTADGGGFVAIRPGWVGLCDVQALDYLREVLGALDGEQTLADNPAFTQWTGMLPEDRGITLYLTAGEDETHALGITAVDQGMDVAYFGQSPALEALLAMLGESPVTDMGPLPADILAAAAFTLVSPDPVDPDGILAGLDMLTAPDSFTQDILPKLGHPTVLFMGPPIQAAEAPNNDAPQADDPVDIPTLGLALKLEDPTAADDLTRMVDRAMLLANLATLEWGTDPIRFTPGDFADHAYRVAHIGAPLAQHTGWHEFNAVQVVYGQVGSHFIICTQEHLFQQCIQADQAGQSLNIAFDGPPHARAKTPILALSVRPDGLADILRTWQNILGEDVQGLDLELNIPIVQNEMAQNIRLFEQCETMKMQLWRGDDGLIVGRIRLTAPE